MTRVRLFQSDDARIVTNFPGQLSVTDIHGEDLPGALLKQAVRETSGRSPNVKACPPFTKDPEVRDCALEFCSAATNVTAAGRNGDLVPFLY